MVAEFLKDRLVGYTYWPSVHKPQISEKYKTVAYKTDLMLVDPETGEDLVFTNAKTGEKVNMLKKAKKIGLRIKEANDSIPGPFVTIQRKKALAEFKKLSEEEKKKWGDITLKMQGSLERIGPETLIGNGSLCEVSFGHSEYDPEKPHSTYLFGMKVINLKSYQASFDEDEFDFSNVKTPTVTAKINGKEVEVPAPFDDDEFEPDTQIVYSKAVDEDLE